MSTKAKRPAQRPKLERKYALKNVNYDASISSTSSPSYSFGNNDGDDDHSSITHRTRSLDLSPNDRTSFRIEGVDGEFDRICRSLGLSGPEDFAIPAAAWEARRNSSPSGGFPSSRFRDQYNSPKEVRVSDDVINNEKIDGKRGGGGGSGGDVRVGVVDDVGLVSERRAGEGIKGLRPPPLLDSPGGRMLAPPPVKRPVVVDDMISTWDICRSFGPEDEEDVVVVVVDDDYRVEGNEDVSSERNVVSEVVNGVRFSDSIAFSESCSDTSEFENDDVYSLRSEPLSGISPTVSPTTIFPNGIFRGSNKSWQKGEFLGSGSFGTVYEGFTDDGFFFAVKEVSLLDQGPQGKQSILQLEQEISLLSRFQHENIVRYHGTDSDDGKLYIFLELVAKGSLASLYQKYHLKDSQVSAYTRQILNGLNYLHKQNVVHRDIKCANILVDVSGSVKLADFGLAKATTLNDVKSCKGTAFWMAPEVVNRKNHGYGLAADIWSLGCTVLEMLTRQVPYSHLEGMQALFRIGRGEPPPLPDSLSTDAKDFIVKCLVVNPDKRPTAAQLLDHPFVKRSSLSTFPSPASPHLAGMRSL